MRHTLRIPGALLAWATVWLLAVTTPHAQGTTGTALGNWSDVRGTNWVVNAGRSDNNVQMWLDPGPDGGFFDLPLVQQELTTIAAAGLNSIRLFGSYYAWLTNRTAYLTNLAAVLAECRRHGLFVTFVVWDCFGIDGLGDAAYRASGPPGAAIVAVVDADRLAWKQRNPTLPAAMGGTWFAAPGMKYLAEKGSPSNWSTRRRADADRYLDDHANAFRWGFPDVFLSYDVINEPDNLTLVGPSRLDAVRIAGDLTTYSMKRIHALHPGARFTIGTASPSFCAAVHRAIRSAIPGGLSYLTFHDYSPDEAFVANVASAVGVGQAEQLEVVCSEFFTAARQGQLPHLLETLTAAGVGAQMWSAVQDRIFVVRYPELMSVAYPSTPTKWWVHDTGVYARTPDTNQPTGYRYTVKNPTFATALRDWTARRTPVVMRWARLAATTQPPVGAHPTARVVVRGPVGYPVTLSIAANGLTQVPAPGLGRRVIVDSRPNVRWLGTLAPTTTPGVGELTATIRLPRRPTKTGFTLQAIVGDDYDPRTWERARRTQLTRAVVVYP